MKVALKHYWTRPDANPTRRTGVEPQIEPAVLNFALEYPAHGQVRVSNELRKVGVFVSPSGVRSIWFRHTLQSRKLRLKAHIDPDNYSPEISYKTH
jgi:hypothetical protein